MVEGDSRRRVCLIVGGMSRDRWITELRRITVNYQVSVARCDNIYTAVTELVRRRNQSVLVVGLLCDLTPEEGRFFSVASRNGARCCAVLEGPRPVAAGALMAAVRGGAAVVDRVDDVRGVIEHWLSGMGYHWERAALAQEEYRATEAELKALLGQEADG